MTEEFGTAEFDRRPCEGEEVPGKEAMMHTTVLQCDLGNLASGFGQPGEKRWSKGNFDCDNDVDLKDLGTLAANFQGGRKAALAQLSWSPSLQPGCCCWDGRSRCGDGDGREPNQSRSRQP
jgi:hypothetical protein